MCLPEIFPPAVVCITRRNSTGRRGERISRFSGPWSYKVNQLFVSFFLDNGKLSWLSCMFAETWVTIEFPWVQQQPSTSVAKTLLFQPVIFHRPHLVSSSRHRTSVFVILNLETVFSKATARRFGWRTIVFTRSRPLLRWNTACAGKRLMKAALSDNQFMDRFPRRAERVFSIRLLILARTACTYCRQCRCGRSYFCSSDQGITY